MRFTFFLLILYNLCLTMTSCCHSDRNPDRRARVNCTGMTLSTVPSVIDPATEVIVLTNNEFVSLTWTSYQSFHKLHELDLSQNKVSSLENISDLILPSLRILRLSGNRLQELPESAFAAASKLTEIYLRANQLHTLNEDTFKDLENLEVLDLSQNLIHVLPLSLLSVMTTKILKTFDVEDNRLKVMPNQFFSKLPDIPYVYLSKNPWVCDCEVRYLTYWLDDQGHNVFVHTDPSHIVNDPESVVCDSPSRLKDRTIIDLTDDEYCSPSGDMDSAPVTTAKTSCCHTDRNPDDRARVNCIGMTLSTVPSIIDPATEVIVLTDNEFVSLSWTSYQSFYKLHELDLSRNKVSSLENISDLILPSLRVLRLSGNRLQELPKSAFAAASKLTEIYLRANQLHTLNEDTFKDLENLEVLDLSQNLIQVLPLSLLSVITTKILMTFDVEDNRLKVMPNQFFSMLPDIPYVYLSKNPWVCDCEVRYLTHWLEDQGHNVYVHTGPSNIVNDPESVVCDSQSRLKDRSIIDLTDDEYCSPSGDMDSAPLTTDISSPLSSGYVLPSNQTAAVTQTNTIIPTQTNTTMPTLT